MANATTYLQNPTTGSSVAAERKTWTFACWFKRADIKNSSGDSYFTVGSSSSSQTYFSAIYGWNRITFYEYATPSVISTVSTSSFHADPTAWTHLCVAYDSTQATASDRVKIYINGTEPGYQSTTYPPQNNASYFGMTNGGDGYSTWLGGFANSYYFDGCMADVYWIGGTAYPGSTFVTTDSVTGEVKPNTAPSITYGSGVATNAHLTFEDASNLGKNTAPGFTSNHWSVVAGNLKQLQDNPSNNFAKFDDVADSTQMQLYQYGTTFMSGNANPIMMPSTLGFTTGKWYMEMKMGGGSGGGGHWLCGISGRLTRYQSSTHLGRDTDDYGYHGVNGDILNNSSGNSGDSYGDTYTSGDYIGIAVDATNNKIYFSKNGTWQNSGDPAAGTNGHTIKSVSETNTGFWRFACGDYDTTPDYYFYANFGDGFFGTETAGTNADGAGYGKFKYTVATGFYSLCTKNLSTYG